MKLSVKMLGWLAPIAVIGIIIIMSSWKTPLWMDEWQFYNLSTHLPAYSSTSEWFFRDRPQVLNPTITWDGTGKTTPITREEAFHLIYDAEVYPHNPLMPLAVRPIIEGVTWLADKGVIKHIEDQPGYPPPLEDEKANETRLNGMTAEHVTRIIRFVPIGLFLASMWLIYKTLFHKVGKAAYFFAVPIAGNMQLLTGIYLFYWDVFMMFFFVLTWYLLECHPKSKWKYVTGALMISTKFGIPFLLLIPLVLKGLNKGNYKDWRSYKMVLVGFAFAPWLITSWIVTGEPFYFFTHLAGGRPTHDLMYQLYDLKGWVLLFVGLGIPFFVFMTFPLFKVWKKYLAECSLLFMGLLYAWGSGLGITHLSTMVYLGALIFPIVVYEFKWDKKLANWITFGKPKKVVTEIVA